MRRADWHNRLVQYLSEVIYAPPEMGRHDCALFLAGAVEAMTGADYAAPYRGRYTTMQGGLRILRKDGFADHIALAAHHLEEIPVAFAAPGDGAVVETEDGPALGVMQGEMIYVVGVRGSAVVPRARATRAFRV